MEAVIHGDDLVSAVAMQLTPFTCQLDGAFIGLRTAVGKEHPVEARCTGDPLGQPNGRCVVERGRWIDQLAALFLERPSDRRRAMSKTIDRPPLDEIQVSLAGVIFYPGALAAHEH